MGILTTIWQIDFEKVFNKSGHFLNDSVRELYRNIREGHITPEALSLYKVVWQGVLTEEQRKNIFREFNRVSETPVGILERLDKEYGRYPMHSLSVGDIIEDTKKVELVNSFGFKDITDMWDNWVLKDEMI